MNVFGLAGSVIGSVNPKVQATLQASSGAVVNSDGSKSPAYAAAQSVYAQVQPLSGRDLRQVEGLNLNGTLRSIYLYGVANATVRVSGLGGDLITLTDGPNAGVWLVCVVSEQWETWVRVIATLQNGS